MSGDLTILHMKQYHYIILASNGSLSWCHWQRSICRKIVEYMAYSLTSRAIAHALWCL